MKFVLSCLTDLFSVIKNTRFQLIKIFLIFLPSLMLVIKFLDEKKYNCSDPKHCILFTSGEFMGALIIFAFILLFFDALRKKVFELLKIYIAATFILFSGAFYLDFQERTFDLNAKKDFIGYQFQLYDLKEKLQENKSDFIEATQAINAGLQTYHDSFTTYEKMSTEYKLLIGQTIICLTIGIFALLLLEVLQYFRERKKLFSITE